MSGDAEPTTAGMRSPERQTPTCTTPDDADRDNGATAAERRLRERREQAVDEAVEEALARLDAADEDVTERKRRAIAALADRLARRATAPARRGLQSQNPLVRERTASLFDLGEGRSE